MSFPDHLIPNTFGLFAFPLLISIFMCATSCTNLFYLTKCRRRGHLIVERRQYGRPPLPLSTCSQPSSVSRLDQSSSCHKKAPSLSLALVSVSPTWLGTVDVTRRSSAWHTRTRGIAHDLPEVSGVSRVTPLPRKWLAASMRRRASPGNVSKIGSRDVAGGLRLRLCSSCMG
ncbi:hypothetical protein EDD16DRAFT_992554 [Pisolithus croceorrhizus]|nr:hypothetical protein EDD16DRAFT_992554 [Pisolithus croceorrhizus]